MNWNAAPEGVEPRYGRVTLEQQAEYLPLAYERVRHDWPWVGVASTWHLKRATDAWEQNGQPGKLFPPARPGLHAAARLYQPPALYPHSPPRHDPRSRAGTQPLPPQASSPARFPNAWPLPPSFCSPPFLRFYALDASSLWNDEGTTWALLSRSFAHVATPRRHPPAGLLLAAQGVDRNSEPRRLGYAQPLRPARRAARASRLPHRPPPAASQPPARQRCSPPCSLRWTRSRSITGKKRRAACCSLWRAQCSSGRSSPRRAAAQQNGDLRPSSATPSPAQPAWTHYSFPILLAAAGAAYVWNLLADRSVTPERPLRRRFTRFAAANLVIVLLFLPWLPTSVMRVLNWPKGGEETTLLAGLRLTLHMFIAGPIRSAPGLAWPWLALGGAVAGMVGLWALHPSRRAGSSACGWPRRSRSCSAWASSRMPFSKFLLAARPRPGGC